MSTVFSPTPVPYAASIGKAMDTMRAPVAQYPQYPPSPFSQVNMPSAFSNASSKPASIQAPANPNVSGDENHDLADVFSSFYSCSDKRAQAQAAQAHAQQMGMDNAHYLWWWQYWTAAYNQQRQSQQNQYSIPPFAYPPPSLSSQSANPYLACPVPINPATKQVSSRTDIVADLQRTEKTSPSTSNDSEQIDGQGKGIAINSILKKRRNGLSNSLEGNITKKSKRKPSQEKVCCNCGTTNTPFWRKDKHGAGALCNACGLYFSKNEAPRPKMLWK